MSLRTTLKKKGYALGDYILRVSTDELEAYLEGVNLPSDEEWARIKEELSQLGLSGILEKPELKKDRIVVARGKLPVPGEDGRLELLIDLSYGPKKVDKHRVDLREMNLVVSVKAGTPVVKRIPPKPGQPGFNVWGEVLQPPPVKEVSFNYGEGLRPDEKNELLIAERDGCLIKKQGKLVLTPTYTLQGDVDLKCGNIRFYGEKLTITGWVRRGFKVLAEGEVEIRGGVENGAEIKVTKDLTVKGIVHGEDTVVEVSGGAVLRAIEYATVKVKKNLVVKEYILQARISVGESFFLIEGRGLLVGGNLEVGKGAIVRMAGNESFVSTHIAVGRPPEILKEIEELKGKLLMLNETIKKLKEALNLGQKLNKEGKLTPEKVEILKKIQNILQHTMREFLKVQEKLEQKKEELASYQNYTLRIIDKIFPRVKVFVGRYKYEVKTEIVGPIEFYLEGRKIQIRSFSNS